MHKKRKVCGWRAYECKPTLGAKSAQAVTSEQTTSSNAAPNRAVNTNLRKFGATCRPVLWLHQSKVHMKRKLWGRRAKNCKPCLGANNAQAVTGEENTPFNAAQYKAADTNLRKFGAPCRPTLWLHKSKVHMKSKLLGKESLKM